MSLDKPPAIGSKVRHPAWGVGTVQGVKGISGYGSVVVKFPKIGVKEVLWIFAKEKMEAVNE